ncbi:class I SAM-dependent methyltransferase [Mycobacterium shigaense]|uniref:O-methyltransferase n=1 Tax=Mycobacterium shigaense TaxID=722731 RepID=A0A1Z4ELY2_9MYCO|nr:class I SAM-dependent methyltransferase [Mycobacterium shigaense]MEA1120921.1 class I SAM-dependent methyltransferase [Mycobacterium shigaense]PRI14698.1 methyltransferase [Mycobacterium shigaense]BAX93979.1 O-methyltransferase [Mycobacterium shigaense]
MTSIHQPEKVSLGGVSETALLTLNARAQAARRPDPVIDDPLAIALVDSIDYDFAKFGRARQDTALRARLFDAQTLAYLTQHPAATVVALAEGLQTSFWRLDAAIPEAQFPWLTVELPEIVDLRSRLLPASSRATMRAQSALDYSWMDAVDSSQGVFITAEGLLMYLQPEQAMGLITQCAKSFPGGRMMFDLPPTLFARMGRRGLRTSRRYRVPPLSFSLSASQAADLVHTVPGVHAVYNLRLPPGRGRAYNATVSLIYRAGFLKALRPCLALLEFG